MLWLQVHGSLFSDFQSGFSKQNSDRRAWGLDPLSGSTEFEYLSLKRRYLLSAASRIKQKFSAEYVPIPGMCILFDLMHSELVLEFSAAFATWVCSHVQVFMDHSLLSALGCFLICLLWEIRRSKLEQSQLLGSSLSNVHFLRGSSNYLSTRIRAAGKQGRVWFVSVLPGPQQVVDTSGCSVRTVLESTEEVSTPWLPSTHQGSCLLLFNL